MASSRYQERKGLECTIYDQWIKGDHSSFTRHISQSPDHPAIYIPPSERTPGYADPQFDSINSRNHDERWDGPASPVGGDWSFDGDEGEQELEGPEDVIFPGADLPSSNMLTSSGESNEYGRRLPEGPREIARANINAQRGEFKDNKYENRWYPYNSRQQFRMARRNVFPKISSREQIRANLVGKLSDRLHPTEQARRFKSVEQFTGCLDIIADKYTPWQPGSMKVHDIDQKYEIWHRLSCCFARTHRRQNNRS